MQGDGCTTFVGQGSASRDGPGAVIQEPDAVFYAAARAWATKRGDPEGATQRRRLDGWVHSAGILSADWNPDLNTAPAPLSDIFVYPYKPGPRES